MRERLVAGCVPFEELVERLTSRGNRQPFVKSVWHHLSMQSHPCFFSLPVTEKGLEAYGSVISEQQRRCHCAALYLLSGRPIPVGKAISSIEPDIIHFSKDSIHGVDLNG